MSTELSKKIWDLKEKGISFKINWKILQEAQSYSAGGTYCDLCTTEKLHILKQWGKPGLLNSRSEMVSKCRHARKFLLEVVK